MRTQNGPTDNPIPDMPPEQPAIDLEILEQLRLMLGSDTPQMMAGLIENYLEHAPKLLKKLRQAARNNGRLSQTAHTLKCRSLTFGAIRLCTLCEELEHSNSAEDIMANLTHIETEYERVKLVLEAEWHRLYEIRLKTDVFFPTGSYKNIGFYPR
jgi:HPt (histidine-containing phosphotransfer) domain-containing protein